MGVITEFEGNKGVHKINGINYLLEIKKNENSTTFSYKPYSKMDRFVISHLRGVANKVAYCKGCKACEVQCPTGAYTIQADGKILIRESLCVHCSNCISFTEKGCMIARSLSVTQGGTGMDLKGMNCYQNFGFQQNFLEHFMEHGEKCFTRMELGNQQYASLKKWLQHSQLIEISNKDRSIHVTDLGDKLIQLGPYNPLTWAIIWCNLAYNSIICKRWYRACNDGAPTAGIQRSTGNSQLKNVLNSLQNEGVLELTSIEDMSNVSGSRAKDSVAALARLVKQQMESGSKVNLSDLWGTLQDAPYGYYDTIACGILLGYVFSCYKNSKYTWTDSAQSPHVLAEATIGKMVVSMCKNRMTTDYLSAGSITWQNFSQYLEKILGLTTAQVAEQTTGYHNAREAVTKSGAPFWALRYLPASTWSSDDLRASAEKVIDNIQVFISQDGDVESAMSNVLQLMQGRGKIRVNLANAFKDKNAMAAAFRSFLFEASPELKVIATKLDIQPEELSDKLHSVMQGAIYTWTEEQVKEKLADVVREYQYIEAIGNVQGVVYHSLEAARKDLVNQFKYLRIALAAIEKLNPVWYPALQVLYKVARGNAGQLSLEERKQDIAVLETNGTYAKDCLTDGKPVLSQILSVRQIECTQDELGTIYAGFKDMSCDATLTQFEKELDNQISRISFARNKIDLQETWKSITGIETVKEWCTTYEAPIMWIIPKEFQKTISTLIDVQKKNHTINAAVVAAVNSLRNMDTSILNDKSKVDEAFLSTVGDEYADIWNTEHTTIVAKAKMKLGNDMSAWAITDLRSLQKMLKQAQQEKAKKEKLVGTKNGVLKMKDTVLRNRVTAFLDAHPEFCDDFTE